MNILPLIFALVLILSVLTVEKLERFKNQAIVQKEYVVFLRDGEREVFNRRQRRLYGETQTSIRQVTIRFLVNKKAREGNAHVAAEYRKVIKALMKVLYGDADFFQRLKNKRGQGDDELLDTLLDAVQRAGEEAPEKSVRRVEDVARLKLGDPDLQEAFYHMLKGTLSRTQLKEKLAADAPFKREKAYVSLLNFIHYEGAKSNHPPRISLQRSPREVLKALFGSEETVEAIMARRNELSGRKSSGSTATLKNEFGGKTVDGIDEQLLDFEVSGSKDKTAYN